MKRSYVHNRRSRSRTLMLTDQERERIRLEEAYRAEIRQSIPNNENKKTVWSFLNSPFGLWLLTSVAIGLISWGYQYYKADLDAKRFKEAKRSSLILEIGFRLQPIEPMQKFEEILDYTNLLDSSGVNRFVINEYKDRTFDSLLWELESVAPDNEQSNGGLLKSFRLIQKTPVNENNNPENYGRFRVFCYYWAAYSNNQSSGALAPPAGLVETDGVEKPLGQQDLDRVLK